MQPQMKRNAASLPSLVGEGSGAGSVTPTSAAGERYRPHPLPLPLMGGESGLKRKNSYNFLIARHPVRVTLA